jgi:hypothetical protein
MRDELQFRILVSIRDDQVQGLDEMSRNAIQSVVESNKELFTQTDKIRKQQDADSSLASMRHNEVLHAITNQEKKKYSIQDVTGEITNRLHFSRKDDRYDDITVAHQNTFNWALEARAKNSLSWPSLADWLQTDGGVYWINGKAGSGKSTLMKYLYQDPRFMELLNLWAGEDRLIVADFYFWNPGAEIQKSQEGLFRSLLWQVLNQDGSLASTLFAEQYLLHAEWDEFPTFHQLRRAFGRLTSHSLTSTKIAIVIDGLDEFDARRITMTELGEMLINATKDGNIKALVSSRPLTEFVDCFAGQPQLQLQQLTHDDITTYVYDHLSEHPQMVSLKASYHAETKALVEEIVSSASGVFLWIKLVVESLLQGLQSGDMVEDLLSRLRSLPQDLEELFAHMLNDVPTLYKSQAACIFQILRCNDEGHQQPYWSTRGMEFPLSAIRLFYAEAKLEEVIGADVSPLSSEEIERRESTTERRLRSRCAGLLELRTRANYGLEQIIYGQRKYIKDVVFLHKTVADFLYQKEVWDELVSNAGGLNFQPSQAVLQSLIMEVKTLDFGQQTPVNRGVPLGLLACILLYARRTEADTKMSSCELLDEVDRAMTIHFPKVTGVSKAGRYKGTFWCDKFVNDLRLPLHRSRRLSSKRTNIGVDKDYDQTVPEHNNFMSLNVRFGLTLYVRDTIQAKGRACLTKPGRPLLDYICRAQEGDAKWSYYSDPTLVQILLLNGANPNDKFNGFSAWQNCLRDKNKESIKRISILKLLVLHGADVNACIDAPTEHGYDRVTALVVVQRELDNLVARTGSPDSLKPDIIELKELLIKRGAKKRTSRTHGNRVTILVQRLLRRDYK